jgi:hypothetical protein
MRIQWCSRARGDRGTPTRRTLGYAASKRAQLQGLCYAAKQRPSARRMDLLGAARRRLALGSLLHERLGAGSPVGQHRDMDVVVQTASYLVGLPPLAFSRLHPELLCGTTDAEGELGVLATATHHGDQSGGTAICSDCVLISTRSHYAEFFLLRGEYAAVGLVRPGWDPGGDERWASATEHAWSFTVWTGKRHHAGQRECWTEGEGRAREGDLIGLLLASGSLSVWKGGIRLGVLVDGLQGDWCWMVTLTGGTSVGIRSIPPECLHDRHAQLVAKSERSAGIAQARAAREAQQQLGEADQAMATGTRVRISGRGQGVVLGFERKRFGPNEFVVEFDGAEGATSQLPLKGKRWSVM